MKSFIQHLRASIIATLAIALACCGLYPLAVTFASQLLFPKQANGSLVMAPDGKTALGSALLSRNFTGDSFFHPRPSSAGADGYDGAASSGSNLGPTSRKLADLIKERVATYRSTNKLPETRQVPADAVTASGSGLDPHISPANAALQAPRVAEARRLTLEKVRQLIAANTDKATFGLLGEDGVNVLKLNLALDATKP